MPAGTRLDLVTKYPGIGTSSDPGQKAYFQGFSDMGGTPETALAIADLIFLGSGKASGGHGAGSLLQVSQGRLPALGDFDDD